MFLENFPDGSVSDELPVGDAPEYRRETDSFIADIRNIRGVAKFCYFRFVQVFLGHGVLLLALTGLCAVPAQNVHRTGFVAIHHSMVCLKTELVHGLRFQQNDHSKT